MDQDILRILNLTGGAAAAVRDGTVIWCSNAARRFGVEEDMPVAQLLPEGVRPESLETMRLLPLCAPAEGIVAQVCPYGDCVVLVLRSSEPPITSDALAQLNRIMAEPISNILLTSRTLFERLEELEDPAIQAETARLNRNFYRLLRMESSLLDLHGGGRSFAPERIELRGWLQALEEKLGELVATAHRRLTVTAPQRSVYATVDPDSLEQALLSMLSNAIRYSPEGSAITLTGNGSNGHCLFTVGNQISEPVSEMDLKGALTRPVSIYDRNGFGAGLYRVQAIAQQHGGLLLLESPPGRFSATLSLPCDRPEGEKLRLAPMKVDRVGGYSRALVELSDVLPDEVFDSRNL